MKYLTAKQQIASMKAAQVAGRLLNFRVSTEDGDTFIIQALSLKDARSLAKRHTDKRHTVYYQA